MEKFFKNHGPFKVSEIAKKIGAEVIGNPELLISDIATLAKAKSSDIAFFNNAIYITDLQNTQAGACILRNVADVPHKDMALLVTSNPYAAYAKAATMFYPDTLFRKTDFTTSAHKNVVIESGAVVSSTAKIGDNVHIGANSYIGDNVEIGENTYISPNCFIICAKIGSNCIIHSGVRIGQDGFGFAPGAEGIIKIPQISSVIIGNNVEIGANTCIDRGALENTEIGNNVKIDNLVQIGHGVVIEENVMIAAQTGIAGSARIRRGTMIAGQVGIAPHLLVEEGVIIYGKSAVTKSVKKGSKIAGSPAVDVMQWHRQNIILQQMARREKK